MKNFLICKENGWLDIVLHALPGCCDPKMEFQWYLINDLNDTDPVKLEKDIYESFVLMLTNEAGNCSRFKGKYIYCHYQTSDGAGDTEPVFLTDDLLQLISRNQFHEILFYTYDGKVDVRYNKQGYEQIVNAEHGSSHKTEKSQNLEKLREFIVEMKESVMVSNSSTDRKMHFDLMRWSKERPYWCVFATEHDERGVLNVGGHYCIEEDANLHKVLNALSYSTDEVWAVSINNSYFNDISDEEPACKKVKQEDDEQIILSNPSPTDAEKELYLYAGFYLLKEKGYKQGPRYEYAVCYTDSSMREKYPEEFRISKSDIDSEHIVEFNKMSETVEMKGDFDIKMLQLIQKRTKELGWEQV